MAETPATESGTIIKMEVDYSSSCDTKIPECKKLAREGKLHDALDQLLALEKLTRTVNSFRMQKNFENTEIFVPPFYCSNTHLKLVIELKVLSIIPGSRYGLNVTCFGSHS